MLSIQSYLQIILDSLPALEINSSGVQTQQAARLQELVEYVHSQVFVYLLLPPIQILLGYASGILLCFSMTPMQSEVSFINVKALHLFI